MNLMRFLKKSNNLSKELEPIFQKFSNSLLRKSFSGAAQKCSNARRPKSQGVRRTWMYAATTKDEGNAADERFSAAC
jgi:hypothetical protein